MLFDITFFAGLYWLYSDLRQRMKDDFICIQRPKQKEWNFTGTTTSMLCRPSSIPTFFQRIIHLYVEAWPSCFVYIYLGSKLHRKRYTAQQISFVQEFQVQTFIVKSQRMQELRKNLVLPIWFFASIVCNFILLGKPGFRNFLIRIIFSIEQDLQLHRVIQRLA